MNSEIIFINDRSGSMASINASAVKGFNDFLDEQRGVPGEARVTTVMFDDRYEVLYQAKPLAQVPYLDTLGPRGNTAMRDAIGRTIEEQGRRISAENWADKIIVVVITDGQDNASCRWSAARLKSTIEEMQGAGWAFVFLAANINAYEAADAIGINRQYTYSFAANAQGTQQSYATASATTRSLRGVTYF